MSLASIYIENSNLNQKVPPVDKLGDKQLYMPRLAQDLRSIHQKGHGIFWRILILDRIIPSFSVGSVEEKQLSEGREAPAVFLSFVVPVCSPSRRLPLLSLFSVFELSPSCRFIYCSNANLYNHSLHLCRIPATSFRFVHRISSLSVRYCPRFQNK